MAGTLKEWQENVGRYAAGNSRLIFALCAAFAGPLLYLLGHESGGFNFVGPSSTGKSTALYLAASVWGKGASGDGYVLPWRATDNGLEGQAALHSDTLLCLDEMSQASGWVVSAAAYMLGNNQGKARANRKGESREVKNWRLIFLSSGEQTLESKLGEDSKKVRAGQAVRLLDIPAEAGSGFGLFENIWGQDSPSAFADLIRKNSSSWYGTAGRAFLARLVEIASKGRKEMEGVWRAFVKELYPSGEDGQVTRAAGRFALCWLAGILAIHSGKQNEPILPVSPLDIEAAIRSCFQAWLAQRGWTGSWEEKVIIESTRAFIQTQRSRFQKLEDVPDPFAGIPPNRAGFKKTDEGGAVYYIFQEVFKKEICNGLGPTCAARVLHKAGMLEKEEGRWTKRLPKVVDDVGRPRMYAVRVSEAE